MLGLLEQLMKPVTRPAPGHTAFSHLPAKAQPGCTQVSAKEEMCQKGGTDGFFPVVSAHHWHLELWLHSHSTGIGRPLRCSPGLRMGSRPTRAGHLAIRPPTRGRLLKAPQLAESICLFEKDSVRMEQHQSNQVNRSFPSVRPKRSH